GPSFAARSMAIAYCSRCLATCALVSFLMSTLHHMLDCVIGDYSRLDSASGRFVELLTAAGRVKNRLHYSLGHCFRGRQDDMIRLPWRGVCISCHGIALPIAAAARVMARRVAAWRSGQWPSRAHSSSPRGVV